MSSQIREDKVKNPYNPTVRGVGYMGDGEYRSRVSGKKTPAYDSWCTMLQRCYDPVHQSRHLTYIGCYVVHEWHNFQVYAEWYYDQPNNKTGFHLDKDLRVSNNKIYGPDTCSFVPRQINNLLNDHAASRGDLPQGVGRKGNGFQAGLKVNGKVTYLGTYSTEEQAFSVYKTTKEDYVKSMAEEWKNWLHQEVYEYLKTWELTKQENKTYV